MKKTAKRGVKFIFSIKSNRWLCMKRTGTNVNARLDGTSLIGCQLPMLHPLPPPYQLIRMWSGWVAKRVDCCHMRVAKAHPGEYFFHHTTIPTAATPYPKQNAAQTEFDQRSWLMCWITIYILCKFFGMSFFLLYSWNSIRTEMAFWQTMTRTSPPTIWGRICYDFSPFYFLFGSHWESHLQMNCLLTVW